MLGHRTLVCVATLSVATLGSACERGTFAPPEGGVYEFDGAMIVGRDAGTRADSGRGSSPDAGRADAGRTDAGRTDAGRDSGAPPVSPRRPDVPYTIEVDEGADLLSMDAWNVLQSETGSYEEIVLIVRNVGSTILCGLSVDAHLLDAADFDLAVFRAGVESAPLSSSSVPLDCLRPGAYGIGWGNRSAMTWLDRVERIVFTYRGLLSPTARSFATVRFGTADIVDLYGGGFFFGLRGDVVVSSGVVLNPQVIVVPRDAVGLPLDRLTDTVLGTFSVGWTFETTGMEGSFTDYYDVISYRDGASPVVVGSAEVEVAQRRAAELASLRAESDARRAADRVRPRE